VFELWLNNWQWLLGSATATATVVPVIIAFIGSVTRSRANQKKQKPDTTINGDNLNITIQEGIPEDTRKTSVDQRNATANNYHQQAIRQSDVQFWFSLLAAIAGFATIIFMMFKTASDAKWYEYAMRVIPGAVIEAVSVLFFTQTKETRIRSNDYFDRLRCDRQIEQSIEVAKQIEDIKVKVDTLAKIALQLCEAGSSVRSVNEDL